MTGRQIKIDAISPCYNTPFASVGAFLEMLIHVGPQIIHGTSCESTCSPLYLSRLPVGRAPLVCRLFSRYRPHLAWPPPQIHLSPSINSRAIFFLIRQFRPPVASTEVQVTAVIGAACLNETWPTQPSARRGGRKLDVLINIGLYRMKCIHWCGGKKAGCYHHAYSRWWDAAGRVSFLK